MCWLAQSPRYVSFLEEAVTDLNEPPTAPLQDTFSKHSDSASLHPVRSPRATQSDGPSDIFIFGHCYTPLSIKGLMMSNAQHSQTQSHEDDGTEPRGSMDPEGGLGGIRNGSCALKDLHARRVYKDKM